jgi:hypothetical protein
MLALPIFQKLELVLHLGHFFKGLNSGIKLLKLLASEGLAFITESGEVGSGSNF